jgi:hypothetical protein
MSHRTAGCPPSIGPGLNALRLWVPTVMSEDCRKRLLSQATNRLSAKHANSSTGAETM